MRSTGGNDQAASDPCASFAKKAIAAGKTAVVYLAKDADPKLTEPLRAMCRLSGIEVVNDRTMLDLGKSCGIAVGTAACAVLAK